jgi:hypothetical protein
VEALAEGLAEHVAHGVENHSGADPLGAIAEPSERQRREEHGKAGRLADRREVAEREDEARDEDGRPTSAPRIFTRPSIASSKRDCM